ncbi:biliverdin-producing heme oxygenase [Actinoplanes xinjiangensis]|uniref:Heme oxygenase n=1 Tax=Actinoplanes xinjiangensis TaxID=512350 RepID=A0A316FFK6_9ACTN|nr:biliverdin-producing heme oxygenase [Actinoplanes xinjiangensis]PWK46486.1 heme oxygenase [Actinoplanes xinjiangensis]GIF40692.1 heme oxygenase [Actinoplanes xinjiangensis]
MTEFSTRLRRATMVEHREAETRGFISRLMAGDVPMAGFAALTAQYLAVYRELEAAADRMRAGAGPAAGFADPALIRVPSLEADLAHLYGPDWESTITVLDSTRAYADRLRDLAAGSPTHFIAHHYVRYLGDLSGGQMIGRTLSNLYGLGEAGTSFYRFDKITDARAYKISYRQRLDALTLPDDDATILIDEAQLAFRFNAAVFVELGTLYPENPEDLAPAA